MLTEREVAEAAARSASPMAVHALLSNAHAGIVRAGLSSSHVYARAIAQRRLLFVPGIGWLADWDIKWPIRLTLI